MTAAGAPCYHCDLPVPPGAPWSVVVGGEARAMCCAGCQAVAETIVALGLDAYYQRRQEPAARPPEALPPELEALGRFDEADVQRDFVRREGAERVATFALQGVRCAACAWLIERTLRAQPGVAEVQVGLAPPRARVRWNPERARVSALLAAVREVGYRALPETSDERETALRGERRRELRRLGVAGLGAMQVMMYAVGLYAGAFQGIEDSYRSLLRLVSWLVATAVVTYSARPFFEGALRDLRARRPGMDVPVALAIGAAYLASARAALTGTGEVYFDSVCMFTFFLGLGRALEHRALAGSEAALRGVLARIPQTARRISAGGEAIVARNSLRIGDRVIVAPGESVPADGRVTEGASHVSEALLTGEASPVAKRVGDRITGGSQNVESPLVVMVERVGAESTLASILSLLDRAQLEKVPIARAADRVARVFVLAVLAIAAGAGLVWWRLAPQDAFPVVLSLLVVSCPCALSIATPAAIASATHALAREGFLVTRGHVLETLARATRAVFDKTGTLTGSELRIEAIATLGPSTRRDVLARAASLEQRSEHPIASAFRGLGAAAPKAEQLASVAGHGVEGVLDGRRHRLGQADWVCEIFAGAEDAPKPTPPADPRSWVLLADEARPLAWFGLGVELRDGARLVSDWLRRHAIDVTLLSGDPCEHEVRRVGEALGIRDVHAGASPEEKLAVLRALQESGDVVVAIGDGVNDAPILARAQMSIAMGGGADLSRVSADAVLLDDRLETVVTAVEQARRTRRVIRQNLGWAVLYNAVALPLAALGAIPPYLAAIGMSASSLIVVGNSLRLGRIPS